MSRVLNRLPCSWRQVRALLQGGALRHVVVNNVSDSSVTLGVRPPCFRCEKGITCQPSPQSHLSVRGISGLAGRPFPRTNCRKELKLSSILSIRCRSHLTVMTIRRQRPVQAHASLLGCNKCVENATDHAGSMPGPESAPIRRSHTVHDPFVLIQQPPIPTACSNNCLALSRSFGERVHIHNRPHSGARPDHLQRGHRGSDEALSGPQGSPGRGRQPRARSSTACMTPGGSR
jgi:hypothetical protein